MTGRAVTMPSMSNPAADISRPHATHEFRLEAAAQARGHAYLRYRDGDSFRVVSLVPGPSALYIGRDEGCAVAICNDERVSRRHARVIFGAGQWSIEDGPSRNGTYVDGKPTVGERLLTDGSKISVGRTVLSFHAAQAATVIPTLADEPAQRRLHPNSTQRKVLVELARPFMVGSAQIPVTPTNAAVAEALGYQPATIRDAISDLYRQAKLERGSSEQRSELVRLAIAEGTVGPEDFA
jgi:hypothetical protein